MSEKVTVPRPAKRIPGLHWWIAGIAIATYGYLVSTFAVNFPVEDDYDNILGFYFRLDHIRTPVELIQLLLSQHNENRLLFNRVVFLLERLLTGGTDFRRLIFIGNLGVLALFGLLIRGYRGSRVFPFAMVITALFLFQPSGYESIFFAMDGLLRNYVLIFALLSFLLLEKRRFYPAAFFACLSLYTQASGLLALCVGAAWLSGQTLHIQAEGTRRRLVSWVVISAGALGVYFYHYVPPPQETPLAESLAHPLRIAEYFLAFAGSAVGYLGVNAAIAAGTAAICLAAYLTCRGYFRRQPALYAFMLFLFGSAALAAVGRSGFGLEQAISSRYSIVSSCLFACVTVGALSLADTRTPWLVAAEVGVIAIALAHACAAYVVSVPAITERRNGLIDGAALFAHCRISAGLQYNGNPLPRGKMVRYMEDRGYWALPPVVNDKPWNEPCPSREGAALLSMPFSLHQYHGDRIAHTGGSVAVQVRDEALHLEVWVQIPDDDPEAAIYIAVPVSPTVLLSRSLETNVAPAAEQAGMGNSGLDITVGFPPNTDLNAVANDMCVGFESTSLPLTLFKGNLPLCAERLALPEDS